MNDLAILIRALGDAQEALDFEIDWQIETSYHSLTEYASIIEQPVGDVKAAAQACSAARNIMIGYLGDVPMFRRDVLDMITEGEYHVRH